MVPANSGEEKHSLTITILSVSAVLLHLLVITVGGYGYFRDELYYIACSKHLAAGYVDQPPLSIFLLAATRLLIGESLFAIRLVPAFLSGLSVLLVCLIVRKMNGGRMAMLLASLAFLAAPDLLGSFTYYSMNSLDIFLWLLATHRIICLVEKPTLRDWIILGIILGAGMMNKISVLWLGAGLFMAILFTDLRRQLRTTGPYAAAFVALVIFSPFVIWNIQNHYPHLEFMRNAVTQKY